MSWEANRKRSICKRVTFTPREWEQVQEFYERCNEPLEPSARPTFCAWARRLLICGYINRIDVACDVLSLRKLIAPIGNNINQIAHVANTTHSVDPYQINMLRADLARLTHAVLEIQDERNRTVTKEEGELFQNIPSDFSDEEAAAV